MPSVQDLANAVSFADTRVFKSYGEVHEFPNGPIDIVETNISLHASHSHNPAGAVFVFGAEVTTEYYTVKINVGGLYSWISDESRFTIDSTLAGQFASDIALFDVYPYLRLSVHQLTSQLGFPFMLPVIRQGEITFTFSDVAGGPNDDS